MGSGSGFRVDGANPFWRIVLQGNSFSISHGRRTTHTERLKGSKTHENLKSAFAGESQANRRYLYFAKQADVEGRPDIAGLFRDTAEGETGHAHGHLESLQEGGDPATGG